MNNVLVIAVHPDDETIAAGGTLLRHKSNGDKIHWLILTGIHSGLGLDDYIITRQKEIEDVGKAYNFDSVNNLNLPTTRLDQTPMRDLITMISDIVNKIKPDIVYIPFEGDVHYDHFYAYKAIINSTKSFRFPFIKKLLMMETISETEFGSSIATNAFNPNVFVDITDFIEKKIEILKIYKSEIQDEPFPRSIKNIKSLASFRGATAGFRYAESFVLLKEII